MADKHPTDHFQFNSLGDHLFVEVPWREAERIRDCLVAHGIPATACYEPYDRAGIALPPDVDLERTQMVLREYVARQAA